MSEHTKSNNREDHLVTTLRRLGREKLAERTIEMVLQLTPDTETVAVTLRAAGRRLSRKVETIGREGARAVRAQVKGTDFSMFADFGALQEHARLCLQETVDAFLKLVAQAEDERFQIEQITQSTTVEQRLSDPVFRARREAAAVALHQAWERGHWIAGAWEAFGKVFDAYRKANPPPSAAFSSNDTGPVRQDLVTRKIVSLDAWKTADR